MGHLFIPTINLGEIITLLLTVGGFFQLVGMMRQELRNNKAELTNLRTDFNGHAEQDMTNFRDLHNALLQVAQHKGDQ